MPLHHLGKSRYESLNLPYPIDGLALIPEEQLQKTKKHHRVLRPEMPYRSINQITGKSGYLILNYE